MFRKIWGSKQNWGKEQTFLICVLPLHMHSLPYSLPTSITRVVHLLPSINLHWHSNPTSTVYITLLLVLEVLWFLLYPLCIMPCTPHCSITLSIFTALKTLCTIPIHLLLPLWQLPTFLMLHSFVFSECHVVGIHTVYCLFRLTSFT